MFSNFSIVLQYFLGVPAFNFIQFRSFNFLGIDIRVLRNNLVEKFPEVPESTYRFFELSSLDMYTIGTIILFSQLSEPATNILFFEDLQSSLSR